MSRRDPRASQSTVRQNDALQEFEQFKKKFLLANKHITKLNSSLSNRCQELEAVITTLNSENIRLHATMIALYAELRREREKSAKLMSEIESSAMHALAKTFSTLRRTFDIPPPSPPRKPPSTSTSTPPKVRRPDPAASPHATRLARAPDFSLIVEEDEEPEPPRRRKTPRPPPIGPPTSSSSTSPPPPPAIVASLHVDVREDLLGPAGKRRISRRQSGLIHPLPPAPPTASPTSLSAPRPPSPAFGSPLRRAAGLAEEADELRVDRGEAPAREDILIESPEDDVEAQLARAAAARKEKRRRARAAADAERESATTTATEAESGREIVTLTAKRRRADDGAGVGVGVGAGRAPGSGLGGLPPLEIPLAFALPTRHRTPDDSDLPTSAFTTASSARTLSHFSTPGTTPAPSHLPTPRASSPPPPPFVEHEAEEEPEPEPTRERRVRKSVNYAEPKLNTKMRKPDPPPGAAAPTKIKRTSSTGRPSAPVRPSSIPSAPDDLELDHVVVKRKKSRPRLSPEDAAGRAQPHDGASRAQDAGAGRRRLSYGSDEDDGEDDGAQADGEYVPPPPRRRSALPVARRGDADERRHSTAA